MGSEEHAGLEEFFSRLRSTRFRGLVALRGSRDQLVELVNNVPEGGAYFYVESLGRPPIPQTPRGKWRVEDRRNSLKHLGHEYRNVVVEVDSRTRASSLAAVSETVVGGGALVLGFLGCGEQTPFIRYLWDRTRYSQALFRIDYCEGGEHLLRLPQQQQPVNALGECLDKGEGKSGALGKVASLARSCDQWRALRDLVDSYKRGARGALVLGDRGRGKSGVMALFAAWLILSRRVSYLPLVSPGLYSMQSFFTVLWNTLSTLGLRPRVRRESGLAVSLSVLGVLVEFVEPGRRLDSEVVLVDEAGPLGVGRVVAAVRRSRFFVATTTVHGYEGGGKTLAQRLSRSLAGVVRVVLEEPIRYPPGDPLERWLYDTLLLDAEPPPVPPQADNRPAPENVVCLGRGLSGKQWFRHAYGILVTAHYRNNPDDLQLLMDEPMHMLCVLLAGDTPLSVAQVNLGDTLIPRLMADLYGEEPPQVARVVRIATHPQLWRRGLGTALLERVEVEARGSGRVLVGASFSNPDALGFWLRNGYRVVHVSPRFNRFTGEKNIVVLKSLEEGWSGKLECVTQDMRWRLTLALPTVYWDLDPQVVVRILSHCPKCGQPTPLSKGGLGEVQVKRLLSRRALGEGGDSIVDLAFAALVSSVADCSVRDLGEEAGILVGLVQGRRSLGWPLEKSELERVSRLVLSVLSTRGEG